MPARKKRRPAETTAPAVDRPVDPDVAPAVPPAVVAEPPLPIDTKVAAPPPASTGRRASAFLDAIAWPFEVVITVCLLPFSRRSGS